MEIALKRDPNATGAAPWHLWAVASLTLIWHCLGAVRYLATQTTLFGTAMTGSPELALFSTFPAIPNAFWALGVWSGLAGSLLLCLRSRWAVQAFVMSLVSLLGVSTWLFGVLGSDAKIYDMPVALATWFVTLASLLYATRYNDTGALR